MFSCSKCLIIEYSYVLGPPWNQDEFFNIETPNASPVKEMTGV
jgi:hypothetical protein